MGTESVSAFSRKVEIGNTTIQNYLDGSLPRIDKAAQIAARTGVSIEWLINGETARDSSGDRSQVQVVRTQQEHETAVMMQIADPKGLVQGAFVFVPRMEARASAGDGLVPESEAIEALVAFEEAYLRSIGVNPRFARLLEVAGDSMHPTLSDRDQVVVDTSIDEVRTDALYAVVLGGAVMVKRLQLQMDGSVLLQSDNKIAGYRDHHIRSDDLHEFKIVGRVRGQFRRI